MKRPYSLVSISLWYLTTVVQSAVVEEVLNSHSNNSRPESIYNVIVTPPAGFQLPNYTQEQTSTRSILINNLRINYALLCGEGVPMLGEGDRPKACNPRQDSELACPSGFWCHIGSSNGTYYCCPESTKASSPCLLGPASGFGSGRMSRWFFDRKQNKCQQMTYTGYGGNENNYLTVDICREKCVTGTAPTTTIPTTTSGAGSDPCTLTADQGNGNTVSKRWFWNHKGEICMTFAYRGSGGNANNFGTVEQCIDACGGGSSDPTSCFLPTHRGSGGFTIRRWSYLPQMSVCQPFLYTGRGGNDNRFTSEQKCRRVCGSARKSPATRTTAAKKTTTGVAKPIPLPTLIPKFSLPPKEQPKAAKPPKGVSAKQARPVVNPCRNVQNDNSKTEYCNNGQQCPSGYFCHSGILNNQNVCCPRMGINPCGQVKLPGVGSGSETRWWYNAVLRKCQPFRYYGAKGNENNFRSEKDCSDTCNVNPCGTGAPLNDDGSAGTIRRCSTSKQTDGGCPQDYFCNPAPDSVNTVCCPVKERPCSLSIEMGIGPGGSVQRWGYSADANLCRTFDYTGVGGNNNNFLTQGDCRAMCQVAINPCGVGVPAVQGDGQTIQCSPNGPACPEHHFCHLGAQLHTTVCCPRTGPVPCLLSLATGGGTAAMSRWYFDAATSTCRAFTYTGVQGNENNFISLADCRRVCPEYDNPCPAGSASIDVVTGRVRYCSAANQQCPANHWCHLGGSRQTSVCCPFSGNPCDMPMFVGVGVAQLPRYYYDKAKRNCGVFTYSGKGGNQNNFLGKAECESACPVLDNPCGGGVGLLPALTSDGNAVFCSVANVGVCPVGYWCHVGAGAATTLCCPGVSDPCRMPLSTGSGMSVLNRWYYNGDTQTCLSFSYTGRGGNQNNFLSLAQCRTQCPEFRNPCSTGQPHIGLSGRITRCGSTSPSICPTTYWCHVGATLDTSVCCPGAGNPCDLPLSVGNGNAQNLLRYHYDRQSRTCQQFRYSGFGGNQNNFMNQQQCEQRCPVFRNPCSTGEPFRDQFNNVRSCSVSNLAGCPSGYWCHVGANEQATICCPGAQNACTQPRLLGTGTAALPRFHYNRQTRQCLPFAYGGIGGNQNNFLSRADCQRQCPAMSNPCSQGDPASSSSGAYLQCSSLTPNVCPAGHWCHLGADTEPAVCCPGAGNPCLLPLSTGNGNAVLSRYYMDPNIRRCSRFTYSGRGGNQNNFLTLQDCQLRCPEFANPCSSGDPAQAPSGGILHCDGGGVCPSSYWCHVGDNRDSTVCCPGAGDPCLQPLMTGSTTARGVGMVKMSRWYFDQNSRRCLQFGYTGRNGNQNNFFTQQDCERQCPVFRNPCGSNVAFGPQQQVVFCTATTRHACPAGHWCHIGVNEQTSVCCPGATDPCQLPRVAGVALSTVGGPSQQRWYYDADRRQCAQMQYWGVGGNPNNFLTQQDCRTSCPESLNPCMQGEPYKDPTTQLVRFCSFSRFGDCPSGYFCHVGASEQATVCCPGFGDACTLPLVTGVGSSTVPRWYFNRESRVCQQFPYSGTGGNQNNFVTIDECRRMCPEFTNPCDSGSPLRSVDGQITYCSAQNPHICPTNYYCHVGLSQESTVCCPAAGDVCSQPVATGRGTGGMQRWRFNQISRRCEPFTYSGVGGNANNFLTVQMCRAKCPEQYNPCAVGHPTGACATGCPSNSYCHTGVDELSTVCCPSQGGNVCEQPVNIGSGGAQILRFYFNSQLASCVSFVYSGTGGNENSFPTVDQCRSRCGGRVTASNPCSGSGAGSSPWLGAARRSRSVVPCGLAVGVLPTVCPSGHYCVPGDDYRTTVCCPMGGQAVSSSVGVILAPRQKPTAVIPIPAAPIVPSSPGQLFVRRPQPVAALSRPREATVFSRGTAYGRTVDGVPLSRTRPELVATRPRPTGGFRPTSVVATSLRSRFCPQGMPLTDVDGRPVACDLQNLDSGGCSAGGTVSAIDEDGQLGGQRDGYVCNVQQSGEAYCCPNPRQFCLLPRNPGPCRPAELLTRYGYNPATDTCVPYKYTGCGGNLNNFANQIECTNICCNKGYNLLSLRDAPKENKGNSTTSGNDKKTLSSSDTKRRRRGWLDLLRFW